MKRTDERPTVDSTHTAAAEDFNGGMQSPYGKFKDLNALLRAYDSLESEFTRRSQRLKELEREAENGTSGGEKPFSAAPDLKSDGQENAYEALIKRFPRAAAFSDKFAAVSSDSTDGNNAERTYIAILENEITARENKLKDRNFLLGAVREDPTISDEVVNSYLKRLISSKPKAVFGGGNAIAAPPRRPNSLSEASAMAENYFNNKKFR